MKTKLIILALGLACLKVVASESHDRWMTLAQIESGDKDQKIGPCGEVSRFQIMPHIWVKYFGKRSRPDERNPITARHVAENIMRPRIVSFETRFKRQPTDAEWVLLWHCPARVTRPTKNDKDMAERFCNLRASK